jgi:Peptidase family S41
MKYKAFMVSALLIAFTVGCISGCTLGRTSLDSPKAAAVTAAVTSQATSITASSDEAVKPPSQPAEWQTAATKDIEAAYQRTVDNHPGMVDPFNLSFPKQLEMARAKGLEFAAKATSAAAYEASIRAFNTVINDGHAGVSMRVPESLKAPTFWPGFMTAWRGETLYVFRSQISEAAAGDKVISCDGVDIKTLIERNVFTYAGRIKEAGRWWFLARTVLIDFENPYVQRPQTCVLKNAAGEKTVLLNWVVTDGSYQAWLASSFNGDRMPIALSLPRPKMFWIGMPTFAPDETERAAYKTLMENLESRRAELKTARAVILDLRHNQGGSSEWSLNIAQALWGKTQVDAVMAKRNAKVEIWWRPTEGHSAYIKSLASEMRSQGRSELQRFFETLATRLDDARRAGKSFYIQPRNAPPANADPIPASDFTTPVFVIMPGDCASACLDAVDYFSQFANTTLIGAPTQADSTYMEVRSEELPSKMARVVLPTKIWVNRPRGNGEIYQPKMLVDELGWTTENFIKRVEKALIEIPKDSPKKSG